MGGGVFWCPEQVFVGRVGGGWGVYLGVCVFGCWGGEGGGGEFVFGGVSDLACFFGFNRGGVWGWGG